MPRKVFIGGNWKSNGSKSSVEALVKGLNSCEFPDKDVEAVVSPIFLHLDCVQQNLRPTIQVAAQNCSLTGNGAYTGEISAEAIADFGLKWVILGHSERRQYYGEDNAVVAQKVAIAQKAGLSVIACFGEKLEERKSDETFKVIYGQLQAISEKVADWSKVVLAYEPVWAIGTGVTASPQQAQEVHAGIRKWLAEKVSPQVADSVRIIYGGSVKPDNAVELMKEKDLDGFLVGGASLKASDFSAILNAPKGAGVL